MPANPITAKSAQQLARLKVRVLKVLLCVGTCALLGFWLIELLSGVISPVDYYAFPALITAYTAITICLFARPRAYAWLIWLTFGIMMLYFVITHWLYFIWPPTASLDALSYQQARIVQWYMLIFIAAFVFFDEKPALLLSFGFYLAIALPEVWFLLLSTESRAADVTAVTLISLVSNPVYIVCLWGVSLLKAHSNDMAGRAAILAEAASHDALTGVLNRRGISKVIETLTNKTKQDASVALILFDLDHFKKINDTFGHARGDATLIALANLVNTKLRPNDHLARWGGEEFLVVGQDMTPVMASNLAERLRSDLDASQDGALAGVTASFGVSLYSVGTESFETALQRADQALYAVKSQGRNGVITG